MSIKQSIASLVILLSVSFNAFASDWVLINGMESSRNVDCLKVGQWKRVSDIVGCKYWHSATPNFKQNITSAWVRYGRKLYVNTTEFNGVEVARVSTAPSCPPNTSFNPETGRCDEPPEEPFCSKDSTQQQMRDYEASCLADGGSPSIVCIDETANSPLDFRMSCDIPPPKPDPDECTPDSPDWPACKDPEPDECTPDSPDWDPRYGMCCRPENNWCDTPEPESCVIGGPNWPACATDTDIDPPTGGDLGDPDKPSGGGTGNPDPDKPEPDVDNTSDTLAAIKSMNSDLNAQLTGINNDMNKNQAETKSALDALKASVDLNTDTVVDNANHVANAIQGQSDMLSDIGNNTNRLLTSANNQLSNGFGQLSSDLGDLQQTNQQGFDELSDKLDDLKPCVPTPENRFCESPHGVDSNFVGDALTQADSIVSGALGSYESTVVGAANDLLEKNITAESEAHITAVSDSFLNLLPQPSQCMRLSLPTLNGGNVSISCEFSHKLKMILSILIYIYTIKTLVEILLTEVTPVPSNKPGSGRYY
ncbi:chemotaxis protein [Vibrio parahaemolyticus]|uniref:chemotaxis protein n=1 Tax=Vibrio parahaemolyticus TaxID=670 RepID=UPI0011244BC5|nr:chemotaxis protein [Vibrio parahaemolyticus]EGR3328390.1 chemotaxis protein [Vibrio parahaemolyticus]EHK9609072.1 chemotaxis protein [Vibrio parahaemolyticus]MQC69371.1 chemotaxis protein [Vibrio parahaemolyticus]MQC81747.1 chemotaxis protein [Vibrio parahaemolyticus]MQC90232.1 chemotaxis protein [Vibrio parahaemolyticus]